jgi:uncharacterized protein YqcC (DUF446 family)
MTKNGQNWEQNPKKPEKTCGNRPFAVDNLAKKPQGKRR